MGLEKSRRSQFDNQSHHHQSTHRCHHLCLRYRRFHHYQNQPIHLHPKEKHLQNPANHLHHRHSQLDRIFYRNPSQVGLEKSRRSQFDNQSHHHQSTHRCHHLCLRYRRFHHYQNQPIHLHPKETHRRRHLPHHCHRLGRLYLLFHHRQHPTIR